MTNDQSPSRRPATNIAVDRRRYLALTGSTAAALAGTAAVTRAASGDVLWEEDFEDGSYADHFTGAYKQGTHDSITSDVAHSGSSALGVTIPEGNHYGIHAVYDPVEAGDVDTELDEMYVSYWVRFSDNFESRSGKLPGVANGEPGGGMGGKPSTGTNGWSARGLIHDADGESVGVGYYVYHMDMDGQYGDNFVATRVPTGEWHHIEQSITLNTTSGGSANADGELRMWVNGTKHIEKTDLRFTLEPERGINFLLNIYHGGNWTAPHDQTVYIDDLTVARTKPAQTATATSNAGTSGDAGTGSSDAAEFFFTEDFEQDGYRQRFTEQDDDWQILGEHDTRTNSHARTGDAALEIPLRKGEHTGIDAEHDPADAGHLDSPAKELYAEYWVKFDPDFTVGESPGGKLPGFGNVENTEKATAAPRLTGAAGGLPVGRIKIADQTASASGTMSTTWTWTGNTGISSWRRRFRGASG